MLELLSAVVIGFTILVLRALARRFLGINVASVEAGPIAAGSPEGVRVTRWVWIQSERKNSSRSVALDSESRYFRGVSGITSPVGRLEEFTFLPNGCAWSAEA